MIKVLDGNRIQVAEITVDDKNKDKELIEYLLGTLLAPLGYYSAPFVQNLNYKKKVMYNGIVNIEKFVELISKNVNQNMEDVWVNYEVCQREIIIKISCSKKKYEGSTYSNKEFMVNVRGKEKMIVDVKADKIAKDDYYWFSKTN